MEKLSGGRENRKSGHQSYFEKNAKNIFFLFLPNHQKILRKKIFFFESQRKNCTIRCALKIWYWLPGFERFGLLGAENQRMKWDTHTFFSSSLSLFSNHQSTFALPGFPRFSPNISRGDNKISRVASNCLLDQQRKGKERWSDHSTKTPIECQNWIFTRGVTRKKWRKWKERKKIVKSVSETSLFSISLLIIGIELEFIRKNWAFSNKIII